MKKLNNYFILITIFIYLPIKYIHSIQNLINNLINLIKLFFVIFLKTFLFNILFYISTFYFIFLPHSKHTRSNFS